MVRHTVDQIVFYAGHVLGAAMFHATCGGQSVLYTGDFNTSADRHLGSASIPRLSPDLIISESTYGNAIRESKRCREKDFLLQVHKAVTSGGKVLIPVFAIGRAQELLMLLESYWERMQLSVPIYFSEGMVQRANLFYKLFNSWTSPHVQHAAATTAHNPFDFRHVLPFEKEKTLKQTGPCVLFATPGMLHAGMALQAFKEWGHDPKNLVLIPGYCVKGTVGHQLLEGKKEVVLDSHRGTKMQVGCQVGRASFSTHADAKGILSMIRRTNPSSVLLVHGDRIKMAFLKRRVGELFGLPCFDPPSGTKLNFASESHMRVHISTSLLPPILAGGFDLPSAAASDGVEADSGYDEHAELMEDGCCGFVDNVKPTPRFGSKSGGSKRLRLTAHGDAVAAAFNTAVGAEVDAPVTLGSGSDRSPHPLSTGMGSGICDLQSGGGPSRYAESLRASLFGAVDLTPGPTAAPTPVPASDATTVTAPLSPCAPPSATVSGYLVLLPQKNPQTDPQRGPGEGESGASGGAVHPGGGGTQANSGIGGVEVASLGESSGQGDALRVQLVTAGEAGELLGLKPHQLKCELTLQLPRRLLLPPNEAQGAPTADVVFASDARASVWGAMRGFLAKLRERSPGTTFEWSDGDGVISHRSLRLTPDMAAGKLRCSWEHSDEVVASACLPLLEQWLGAMVG